ncbi:MAG TPA: LTA synthase family protein [Thermoanaerobaculia bacterium]|nr:LTA synthase family protein [Thermoanaerobaculia bacterium]
MPKPSNRLTADLRAIRGLPLLFFLANVAIFTILRVVFYFAFRKTAGHLDSGELVRAFYLGLKFDARLAAIFTLPMLASRRLATAYVVIIETLLLMLYAADFGTYAYIHQRINAEVLEFLRNPLISLHMVWESYHVVLFGGVILAVLVLIVLAVRWTIRSPKRAAGMSWMFVVFLLACIYGKVSRYPLRWSDAYFSRNPFIGTLALNPAQFLFETLREKPAAFDQERLASLYPILVPYLGIDHPDPKALSFRRTPALHSETSGTPNVVLIQLESFAAYKSGAFGNKMGGCPNVDALARDGILFTNHYSPSEKTARALFAVVFGIPDVSSWQASAHNPLTVDQTSIVNAFAGYDKFYFLGGSANWSNIRGMLEHNLDHLHIFEEGSYNAPVDDVWGISDEDLLLAANDVLKREDKPFFAILHTSGNHRPYTIPKQTHGFALRHVPDDQLHANWFDSNEEFNSFRYLDHAVGLFMNAARKERYFANTVFVLYGDHGTRTGAPGSALEMGDLSKIVYHVPLIIYAPGFVHAGRRLDTPSSHIDIMPTIASFCGRPYVNQTLGLDLLDPSSAGHSVGFVFTTFHDPPDLEVIGSSGTTITRHDERKADLGSALYEASRWLLYHNH